MDAPPRRTPTKRSARTPARQLRDALAAQEDLELTYDCIQIGKQLDIALVDHLIIGAGQWVSVWTWLKRQGQGIEE